MLFQNAINATAHNAVPLSAAPPALATLSPWLYIVIVNVNIVLTACAQYPVLLGFGMALVFAAVANATRTLQHTRSGLFSSFLALVKIFLAYTLVAHSDQPLVACAAFRCSLSLVSHGVQRLAFSGMGSGSQKDHVRWKRPHAGPWGLVPRPADWLLFVFVALHVRNGVVPAASSPYSLTRWLPRALAELIVEHWPEVQKLLAVALVAGVSLPDADPVHGRHARSSTGVQWAHQLGAAPYQAVDILGGVWRASMALETKVSRVIQRVNAGAAFVGATMMWLVYGLKLFRAQLASLRASLSLDNASLSLNNASATLSEAHALFVESCADICDEAVSSFEDLISGDLDDGWPGAQLVRGQRRPVQPRERIPLVVTIVHSEKPEPRDGPVEDAPSALEVQPDAQRPATCAEPDEETYERLRWRARFTPLSQRCLTSPFLLPLTSKGFEAVSQLAAPAPSRSPASLRVNLPRSVVSSPAVVYRDFVALVGPQLVEMSRDQLSGTPVDSAQPGPASALPSSPTKVSSPAASGAPVFPTSSNPSSTPGSSSATVTADSQPASTTGSLVQPVSEDAANKGTPLGALKLWPEGPPASALQEQPSSLAPAPQPSAPLSSLPHPFSAFSKASTTTATGQSSPSAPSVHLAPAAGPSAAAAIAAQPVSTGTPTLGEQIGALFAKYAAPSSSASSAIQGPPSAPAAASAAGSPPSLIARLAAPSSAPAPPLTVGVPPMSSSASSYFSTAASQAPVTALSDDPMHVCDPDVHMVDDSAAGATHPHAIPAAAFALPIAAHVNDVQMDLSDATPLPGTSGVHWPVAPPTPAPAGPSASLPASVTAPEHPHPSIVQASKGVLPSGAPTNRPAASSSSAGAPSSSSAVAAAQAAARMKKIRSCLSQLPSPDASAGFKDHASRRGFLFDQIESRIPEFEHDEDWKEATLYWDWAVARNRNHTNLKHWGDFQANRAAKIVPTFQRLIDIGRANSQRAANGIAGPSTAPSSSSTTTSVSAPTGIASTAQQPASSAAATTSAGPATHASSSVQQPSAGHSTPSTSSQPDMAPWVSQLGQLMQANATRARAPPTAAGSTANASSSAQQPAAGPPSHAPSTS